jgi:hypothetical protein
MGGRGSSTATYLTEPARKIQRKGLPVRGMKPWCQSIHREETGTAVKHLPKQHDDKASARANAVKHPRAGGITRTAEPKRQWRQSIRQSQHGKASAGRGHHTHGGAQATMVTKHPPGPTRQSIRGQGASRARRSPSDDCGNTKHLNWADQSEDKTKAHAGTTQLATTPARDGWPQARPMDTTAAANRRQVWAMLRRKQREMCCSSAPTMPSGRIMTSTDANTVGSTREGLSPPVCSNEHELR